MMDVPFISRFISDAINAAAREYIAPKSLMLDLQQLLSGDGINRGEFDIPHFIALEDFLTSYVLDTVHIGVVVVHVHKCIVEKNTESDSQCPSITGCLLLSHLWELIMYI